MKSVEEYVDLAEEEIFRSKQAPTLSERDRHVGRAAVYAQLAAVAQSAPATLRYSASIDGVDAERVARAIDDGHGPRETSR